MQTIFQDEYVRVVHKPSKSRFVLLPFNHLRMGANDANFWAERLVDRAEISALGFVNATSNWFPRTSMIAAAAACRPVIASYEKSVTYGASMGAYAALRYSRLLGVDAAVGFSPQFSIDPDVVGAFDRRYLQFFKPELNRGMEFAADEVIDNAFLFYDNLHKVDQRNMALILGAIGPRNVINVPTIGHEVISIFARTPLTAELLRCCLAGDAPAVRTLVTNTRRAHALRLYHIIKTMAERRPQAAAAMLRRAGPRLPPERKAEIHEIVADQFLKRRKYTRALKAFETSLALAPANPDGRRRRIAEIDRRLAQIGKPVRRASHADTA